MIPATVEAFKESMTKSSFSQFGLISLTLGRIGLNVYLMDFLQLPLWLYELDISDQDDSRIKMILNILREIDSSRYILAIEVG